MRTFVTALLMVGSQALLHNTVKDALADATKDWLADAKQTVDWGSFTSTAANAPSFKSTVTRQQTKLGVSYYEIQMTFTGKASAWGEDVNGKWQPRYTNAWFQVEQPAWARLLESHETTAAKTYVKGTGSWEGFIANLQTPTASTAVIKEPTAANTALGSTDRDNGLLYKAWTTWGTKSFAGFAKPPQWSAMTAEMTEWTAGAGWILSSVAGSNKFTKGATAADDTTWVLTAYRVGDSQLSSATKSLKFMADQDYWGESGFISYLGGSNPETQTYPKGSTGKVVFRLDGATATAYSLVAIAAAFTATMF